MESRSLPPLTVLRPLPTKTPYLSGDKITAPDLKVPDSSHIFKSKLSEKSLQNSESDNEVEYSHSQIESCKDKSALATSKPVSPKKKTTGNTNSENITTSKVLNEAIKPVKPKRKKKKSKFSLETDAYSDRGLGRDIAELIDDVVSVDQTSTEIQQLPETYNIQSQPVGKLFIEQHGHFITADKAKFKQLYGECLDNKSIEQSNQNSLQVGIRMQRAVNTFSLLCHGLAAGFAFWQCVSVFLSTPPYQRFQEFLTNYSLVSLPVQAFYYFLLAICVVAAFDRFDGAFPNQHFFRGLIAMHSAPVLIIIYVAAILSSLCIADMDDKMWLQKSERWNDVKQIDEDLTLWRILNLVRAVLTCLGWLIIVISPTEGLLLKNLQKSEEEVTTSVEGFKR